jgi:HEAT repeat protein
MKAWRIHLAWALVTVIVAAVWGHRVASRLESAARGGGEGGRHGHGRDREISAGSRVPYQNPEPFGPGRRATPPTSGAQANAPSASLNPSDVEEPTPEAIRALLRDRNQWSKAFEALRRLESRSEKLGLLAEAITGKPIHSQVPHVAINCLVELGGTEAVDLIEQALRTPETEGMCSHAARALGTMGDPKSVAALLEAYHSGSMDLKVPCAASLNALGQPGPAAEVLATLSRSLEDSDGAIRRDAVENISSLVSPSALPLLARALRDSNGDVRVVAIYGLEALGTPEIVQLLEPIFNDANPSVAQEAREAVERLQKSKKK